MEATVLIEVEINKMRMKLMKIIENKSKIR